MQNPLRLAYYKGVTGKFGAIQFNLQRPHFYCPRCKSKDFENIWPTECKGVKDKSHEPTQMQSREGCIFMEITSASGPNVYDWDNKIIISLSLNDIAKFLFALETGEEVKLMHDPGAKSDSQGKVSKNLQLSSPKGVKVGVLVTASMKQAGVEDVVRHTVPLDGAEVKGLSVMLRAALPATLCWD